MGSHKVEEETMLGRKSFWSVWAGVDERRQIE
jgi:hypothetical protein